MALPKWLDSVPNMSFEREKQLLVQIQRFAGNLGWKDADTTGLAFSSRQETDVALQKGEQFLRLAVLPKSKENQGAVRLQAIPTFSEAEYVWKPRKGKWEIEIGSVPMDKFDDSESFSLLLRRLFSK